MMDDQEQHPPKCDCWECHIDLSEADTDSSEYDRD